MPLVKSYRRYEPGLTVGVVCAGTGNVVWLDNERVAVPALGCVQLISTRTAEVVGVLGNTFGSNAVTAIALHPDKTALAVGHEDGAIVLWSTVMKL